MLNTISDVTAAADPRYRFSTGVFPLSSAPACAPGSTGAVARHPGYGATAVLSESHFVVGHDMVLGQQNPNKQHDASMTRIAAAGGGALGSHPAREPEPV